MRARALLLAFVLLLGLGLGPAARAEESRYAGSELSLKHAAGVWTGIPGADPTYNPLVRQTVAFLPRLRLDNGLRLRGYLGVETELTDSDTSARKRQPLVQDAWLESAHGLLSLRLYLPTSRESWARRRIFSLEPAVTVKRTYGRFTPRARASAAWHAATEETAVYDAPSIAGCDPGSESCEAFTHSGERSALATFVQAVGVDVALPHALAATVEVWWIESLLYPLDGEAGGTWWRFANLYHLGLHFRATPAWRLAAGFETVNPQRAPDGDLQRPFFNRHTQLYLSASRVF